MDNFESETVDLAGSTISVEVLPTCAVGDVLSNRYRLDEEIGRGGMGVVFRAWDVELERRVAVKILAALLRVGDARERLFREARAAAALSHPRVVAVYDVGEHHNMPYFVMELVDGPSLKERPPETLEETLAIALQICEALAHAHDHGLVHRDLKPGNILLAGGTSSPAIKLVDLGLAVRERGVRLTREGGISGTVNYMAPEQALGQPVDGRADLYALGVMLYELTTGRLPFDGDNALSVISQHLHAPVVPPRTYSPGLPQFVDCAILRLLEKAPEDRFATAAEVAKALTQSSDVVVPAAAGVTALGSLARGRMVGRDAEIDALRRSWSEAVRGSGGMVLVSGEPGSGKTRLARELVDYARITGGVVLQGGCFELEAATPYLPFVEALRAWAHSTSDDELRRAVGDAGAELSRLAPELESRIGPFPEGPELSAAERRLPHAASFTSPSPTDSCSWWTICSGPTRHRFPCSTTWSASPAESACSPSAAIARPISTAPTRWPRLSRPGTASGRRRGSTCDAWIPRGRQRCWLFCSVRARFRPSSPPASTAKPRATPSSSRRSSRR
ncbi:MAG: protein kinase [Acidobacteriota bacterium]